MASEKFILLKPISNATLALSVHNALGVSLQQSSDTNLFQVWRCEDLGGTKGFVLVHQASNRALSWKQSGHKVRLEPYVPKAPTPQQVWNMTDIADSQNSPKRITAFQDMSICLDMKTGSVVGAEIFAAPWKGIVNQQWIAVDLPEGSLYPMPMASHAEVSNDKHLFLTTLSQLHLYLGNTLKIPLMGGKELDLHLLYREVTRKGGLAQVTTQKSWKGVAKAFGLPPTITSASYILRKFYTGLLHHFEQLYFFCARGPLIPPSSVVAPSFPRGPRVARIEPELFGIDMQLTSEVTPKKMGRSKRSVEEPETEAFEDPQEMLGQAVTGTIHSKFDLGYFVTVQVGAETLKGILYHPPKGGNPHPHSILEPKAIADFLTQHKMMQLSPGDPGNTEERLPYDYFFSEWHYRLKEMNPDATIEECGIWLTEQWKGLPDEIKKNYEEMAAREKGPQGQGPMERSVRIKKGPASGERRVKERRRRVSRPMGVANGELQERTPGNRAKQPGGTFPTESKDYRSDDTGMEEDAVEIARRGLDLF